MLYEGALNAALFLAFVQRLVRSAKSKVFLIVDNLKVHKAGKVEAWVAAHRERIALFFLPAWAPEHNPDEFLHSDLKQSLGRRVVLRRRTGPGWRAACAATCAGYSASPNGSGPSFERRRPAMLSDP